MVYEREKGIEGAVNLTTRDQKVFVPDHEIKALLEQHILKIVPDAIKKLGMRYHQVKSTSLEIAATGNGQFAKTHSDRMLNQPLMSKIAFVYYFHKVPKAFTGGDILVYDTDIQQDKAGVKFTKIHHTNNRIVAYPSCFYHEITQVSSPSGLFADCRFAIPFWVTLV